jgi:FMN phosphatase YigB (HAD superfamily)
LAFPKTVHSLGVIQNVLKENSEIQVVTFDLFDTLVQWTSSVDERHEQMWIEASRVLASFAIRISPFAFAEIRNRLWYDGQRTAHSSGREFQAVKILQTILATIALTMGRTLRPDEGRDIAGKLEAAFIRVDARTIVTVPDARRVLSRLKTSGYRTAVISNHPFSRGSIELILRKCRLMTLIDTYFVSSEVGRIKSPNDRGCTIFRKALSWFRIEPAEALHIGNELEADYQAPRYLGMRAIVCDNQQLLTKLVPNIARPIHSAEYKLAAIEAFRIHSQLKCKGYYRQNLRIPSRDCEDAAIRLHELSRDVYAPLLIKFSEDNLAWLKQNPGSINLCLGRDGLASFLIQRKLIELFPQRYAPASARDVQYINISRQLMLTSGCELIREYLHRVRFFESKSVTLIDNGIVGTIQNAFHELFPAKPIFGRYLLARRLVSDKHRLNKTGFIVQTDCDWRGDRLVDLNITGGKAEDSFASQFLTAKCVHLLEDIWNGINESPGRLVREDGTVRPENDSRKIAQIPGYQTQIRGLSINGNYSLLKKLALRGLVEGVLLYERQCELGLDYKAEDAIEHFVNWSRSVDNGKTIKVLDSRIVKALARSVPSRSSGSELLG